ncbi:hypothetical protein NMQ03_05475 [Arthrobacter sp. DNA4]|uniref:hypothetical protein n=1 Tax=Arthrobacter sp. DNA4 TaxID=2963432 RepID=UPI0020CE6399|nr:hypothetical protein [Arthrobacter sp. DNA4]UTT70589.1 hypothetical protein NMQ03_05475 [Arthrobacter sp. DNA4]
MFKFLRRKGIVLVSTDDQGQSSWQIDGRRHDFIGQRSDLQAAVSASAAHHAKRRKVLVYEEVPVSKIRPFYDELVPIILAILIAGSAFLFVGITRQPEITALSLTALLNGIAFTLAIGHAGWVLARACGRGRRFHPMSRTVWKQHWKLLACIAACTLLGLGFAFCLPDQSRLEWAVKAYEWFTNPWGAVGNMLGFGWLSIFFLVWELLRGFTASSMLVALNGAGQQQYRLDHPVLGWLYGLWQWRVDLAH